MKVVVEINDVDDGATVYLNGAEILHVDYMHQRSVNFIARNGDQLGLVIHNMTGGEWHAEMIVNVDGAERFRRRWQGSSFPLVNEAMRYDLIL